MHEIPATIFREYQHSEGLKSDRSARDRARHRQLVKDSIKGSLPDIISEESIIGRSKDKVIKVPIKGKREFRFVYGDNGGGVGTGDGNAQPGQVIGKTGEKKSGQGKGEAGDQAGEDIYTTEITLDELLNYLFEDLKLPNMKKTNLKELTFKSKLKRDGYRKVGIPVRLDRIKSARQRVKRIKAMQRHSDLIEECPDCTDQELVSVCKTCGGTGKVDKRVRFRPEDLKYRHMTVDPKPQSNAAIIFILDTSGSMDRR